MKSIANYLVNILKPAFVKNKYLLFEYLNKINKFKTKLLQPLFPSS